MITDSSKLERIQREFTALWQSSFLQDMEFNCDNLLERLDLLTLRNKCRLFEAFFLINIFIDTKFCPSILETVGLEAPTRNIRNFTVFICSSSHRPSAKRFQPQM
jgi:hypothetical protein